MNQPNLFLCISDPKGITCVSNTITQMTNQGHERGRGLWGLKPPQFFMKFRYLSNFSSAFFQSEKLFLEKVRSQLPVTGSLRNRNTEHCHSFFNNVATDIYFTMMRKTISAAFQKFLLGMEYMADEEIVVSNQVT